MILRSYFDAGNQANSRQYDVVSLAVSSATTDEWGPFETDWRDMLKRHHVDYLHTTDAVARVNLYTGWSETKADSFLRDCVRIASKHFIRMPTEYDPGQFGLYCFVVSIDLKDFVTHAQGNPAALNDANEGCFRQAIADTIQWATDKAACDEVHCFFDQGEPFFGFLVNLLNSKQAKKEAWRLNMVTAKAKADSRHVPALQFSDLFAWVESHKNDSWNPEWKRKLLLLPYWREWIDKNNLHQVHPGNAAWRTWKIPKRAATK